MSQVTVEELRRMLEEVPFVKLLGIEVVGVDEGMCRVRLPYHERLEQYYHIIHGGVIASLVDTAMYLAQTTLNGITKNTVTTEMKVNFLASARQEDLFAEARILKNGRNIIYGDTRITGRSEKLIAHATVTYMRLDYDMRA